MQSFRENKAYRISLYLILSIPIFLCLAILLTNISRGIFTIVFLVSISLLFLVALLLRILSNDLSKHWADILFIVFAIGINIALIIETAYTCPAFINGTPSTIYYQQMQSMMESMFDPCSPFNIYDIFFYISYVLFFTGLILAIKLLISDIKRKRAAHDLM